MVLSTATRAIQHFVLGVILVLIFAVSMMVLPSAGHGSFAHAILPILTLALGLAAVSLRVTRDATVSIASSAYYAFGNLKRLSGFSVFMRHGLRIIGVPIITYLGVQLVYLIEGLWSLKRYLRGRESATALFMPLFSAISHLFKAPLWRWD